MVRVGETQVKRGGAADEPVRLREPELQTERLPAARAPGETRARLDTVVTAQGRASSWNAVADILDQRLPHDVARALEAADLTHARYAPTLNNAQMIVALPRITSALAAGWLVAGAATMAGQPHLGALLQATVAGILALGPPRWSPVMQLASRASGLMLPSTRLGIFEVGGEVAPQTGTFDVSAPAFRPALERAGIFTHECLHVLDFSCAKAGSTCSTEPDFVAIAERTLAGGPGHAYPSAYARENLHELFAEAGSAYLDLPKAGCMTKAELRAENPELYAYFERFFGERVPEALQRGAITKASQWNLIDEADAYKPGAVVLSPMSFHGLQARWNDFAAWVTRASV